MDASIILWLGTYKGIIYLAQYMLLHVITYHCHILFSFFIFRPVLGFVTRICSFSNTFFGNHVLGCSMTNENIKGTWEVCLSDLWARIRGPDQFSITRRVQQLISSCRREVTACMRLSRMNFETTTQTARVCVDTTAVDRGWGLTVSDAYLTIYSNVTTYNNKPSRDNW